MIVVEKNESTFAQHAVEIATNQIPFYGDAILTMKRPPKKWTHASFT